MEGSRGRASRFFAISFVDAQGAMANAVEQ